MTLHLHRAPRTDLLADALGELLATPLDDPFAEEVVVVPAKGVERWLTQRLSQRLGTGPRGGDGVCAGVRFVNPASLVSLLLGRERDDPWRPDRLAWPVLDVLDEALAGTTVDPWCAALARHLGHDLIGEEAALRRTRRWSVARRLAGLFASYADQRPAVLEAWGRREASDGAGAPLPADLEWQPELWRRVLARVGAPAPDVRHADTVRRLRAGDATLDLPHRLSLFGHTRLSATEVDLLGALGSDREVHVWLPHPSAALWEGLAPTVEEGPVRRRLDRSAQLVDHPLLLSLGRDIREARRTLGRLRPDDVDLVDEAVGPGPAELPDTLLGWLQADLRRAEEPGPTTRAGRVLAAGDTSVQVHSCHGTARQVEVLREVLVGLLDAPPRPGAAPLEPRDVLVMCPDVDVYAPLVQAAFGLAVGGADTGAAVLDRHPAHGLRVRLADRGALGTNPLLEVAMALLLLADGRATASDVLDLAGRPGVRSRFALSDDDLTRLAGWVDTAGIRWGLRADTRAPFLMDGFRENTWEAGLDRLLLGVAMADEGQRAIGTGVPVDDVGSGDIDLAGRLAELVSRLEAAVASFAGARSAADWSAALVRAVLSMTSVGSREQWQRAQLEREVGAIATDATAGDGALLRLPEVRLLLSQRTGGRPTRSSFRTGSLTVCTMTPMRSVPHRVVCLLGLDDGVFPRSAGADGDDVLARDPVTGERDARSEDRQLLLDAVLAATETLVITYSGASEHSGQTRPPSVPLGVLLDSLDRTTASPVIDRVVVEHPLQPFAEANFRPADGRPALSYDRAAASAALAARSPVSAPPFVPGELPPPADTDDDIALADLVAFFKNPARAFLRRVDVSTPRDGDEVKDAMPIDLDGLEKWQIGDRLVSLVADGGDADAACRAEVLRGGLPPGALGRTTLDTIRGTAEQIVAETDRVRSLDPEAVEVVVPLPDGRRVVGRVPHLHGPHLLRLSYSKVQAKHLLPAWIEVLALAAVRPDVFAHCLGRGERKGTVAHTQLGWLAPGEPVRFLADLVSVRDDGLRSPLLVPVATGYAWALAALAQPGNERFRAGAAWEGEESSPVPGEREDAAWVRVLGRDARLDRLAGLAETSARIWHPLLGHAKQVAT